MDKLILLCAIKINASSLPPPRACLAIPANLNNGGKLILFTTLSVSFFLCACIEIFRCISPFVCAQQGLLCSPDILLRVCVCVWKYIHLRGVYKAGPVCYVLTQLSLYVCMPPYLCIFMHIYICYLSAAASRHAWFHLPSGGCLLLCRQNCCWQRPWPFIYASMFSTLLPSFLALSRMFLCWVYTPFLAMKRLAERLQRSPLLGSK